MQQGPLPFHSQDSNTGQGSCDGHPPPLVTALKDLEEPQISPQKPVTTARTPTERKRKRKKASETAGMTLTGSPADHVAAGVMGVAGPDSGNKGAKPISDYFSKRAPSSPVRSSAKSQLSFGNASGGIYPPSPKAQYVGTSNGPMGLLGPNDNGGEYSPLKSVSQHTKLSQMVQTDLCVADLNKTNAELESRDNRIDELQRVNEEMTRQLNARNKELEANKNSIQKCLSVVKELLIEKSKIERKDARSKCMQNRLRLGQFVTQRVGASFQENWTDGHAFQDLTKRQEEIAQEREEIDKKKKQLTKRKPIDPQNGPSGRKRASVSGGNSSSKNDNTNSSGSASSGIGSGGSDSPKNSTAGLNRDASSQGSNSGLGGAGTLNNGSGDETMFTKPPPRDGMTMQEYYEAEEILKLRYACLRKEDADLQIEMEKLERKRNLHIRELKRINNEDQSRSGKCFRSFSSPRNHFNQFLSFFFRYNDHPMLNDRYLLLMLLGKGGFSEVHKVNTFENNDNDCSFFSCCVSFYQAFDTKEQRYVACKIHQLNKDWKDDKKANYIKHALREYNIHKNLQHPRIVSLFDVFEIDANSFCTVLEYCDGHDLDFYLKQVCDVLIILKLTQTKA